MRRPAFAQAAVLPRSWLFLLLVGVGSAFGCGGTERSPTATGPAWSGTRLAPPLPGHSLYESVECRCTMCRYSHCCGGESETSDECSEQTECELTVGSCFGSCAESTWRVPKGKSCDVRRPEYCCGREG